MKKEPIEILVAEDEDDQCLLIEEACNTAKLNNKLHFVKNGIELLDFLKAEGKHSDRAGKKLPGLILLDLNMPKKNGRQALSEIKSDPRLRLIPVIVMTSSNIKEDINESYAIGANSYIRKPVNFQDLLDMMISINHYWFQIVALPESS